MAFFLGTLPVSTRLSLLRHLSAFGTCTFSFLRDAQAVRRESVEHHLPPTDWLLLGIASEFRHRDAFPVYRVATSMGKLWIACPKVMPSNWADLAKFVQGCNRRTMVEHGPQSLYLPLFDCRPRSEDGRDMGSFAWRPQSPAPEKDHFDSMACVAAPPLVLFQRRPGGRLRWAAAFSADDVLGY